MSAALSGWRKPLAVHDPAKVVLDLAVTLALGGDCMADALLRSEPGLYGRVASDATVSRTMATLAGDAPAALAATDTARGVARVTALLTHVQKKGTLTQIPDNFGVFNLGRTLKCLTVVSIAATSFRALRS